MILKVDFFDEEYPVFNVCKADLYNLLADWKYLDSAYDGQLSGIIADYIEENMTMDWSLSALVSYMRECFNSYEHNRTTPLSNLSVLVSEPVESGYPQCTTEHRNRLC